MAEFNPDYKLEYRARLKRMRLIRENEEYRKAALVIYKNDPVRWIEDWCITYDPRAKEPRPKEMPFILFERQKEFIEFLWECLSEGENGLIEKARDMGATWVGCAFSVWLLLFHPHTAVSWGSRKQDLVDKLGDPDSIFEKMRMILRNLPRFMLPPGFNIAKHAPHLKIINVRNGASITGEAGDNIGRGGRSSIYFKDEAQPNNTPILTPNGFMNMGSLKIGDKVIGVNGKAVNITQIKEFNDFEVYKIKFSDGTYTEATPSHLWKTLKKGILSTKELLRHYKYISPKGRQQYRCVIPVCSPIDFKSKGELPLHPYIIGALIGDGSLNNIPKYRASFTSADVEIADRIKELLPKTCAMKKTTRFKYCLNDVKGARGKGKISRMSLAIMEAGVANCRAENKFIPDKYLFASIPDRIELLRGLMDTDGSINNGTATYHTCSKKLADNVRFLVQGLGGLATLNTKPSNRGYRDMYVLHIKMPREINPFYLPRKANKVNRRQAIRKTVVGIEKVDNQPCRCITVDAKDGLYLANDCIVTHNSAYYERPELVEAALGDNTDVQIDMSSVNGANNPFYRRRMAGEIWEKGKKIEKGVTRVFIMDWRDHPYKTQAWYDQRRRKAEKEGILHILAQEVDRDYSASLDRIIIPQEWVKAAIDAHIKLKWKQDGMKIAAMDVADEGGDKHALAQRQGVILRQAFAWGQGDTGEAARKAIQRTKEFGSKDFYYDAIGVGAGVKAETNRLKKEGELGNIKVYPWNAGASPLDGNKNIILNDRNTPKNEDFFVSLRVQAWWRLSKRFYKTYRAITKGEEYPGDELISLDSNIEQLHELCTELSQVTQNHNGKGKMIIDKKPDGAKSPNLADSVVMCYCPNKKLTGFDVL